MAERKLQPNWPTRWVEVSVSDQSLRLLVPDNPYEMLDLPAVEQAFADDEYMPYWAHLWPACFMLSDWLIDQQGGDEPGVPPPPARVLEIGCGLGLAGLIVARLGYRVTLTDYDDDALEFVRRSGRANDLRVRVARLDWRQPPTERFPIIIAADVLYEQRSHGPVLETLRLSLESGGVAALADPNRQVCDNFPRDARAAGWLVNAFPARWEQTAGRIFVLRRQ